MTNRIYTITKRDKIRDVAKRWHAQYGDAYYKKDGRKLDIFKNLTQLDLDSASEVAVSQVIGNDSWTRNECGVCGQDSAMVVHLGETSCLQVCLSCLQKAIELLEAGR